LGREVAKLTALKVEKLKAPGFYADGAGLYLQVTGNGRDRVAKSWIFRYTLNGRTREMGLGSLSVYGLADARMRAAKFRRLRDEGVDPVQTRNAERAMDALRAASSTTFCECRQKYIAAHRTSWRNQKHASQWETTLERYAEPAIGTLSIQAIDTGLILKVLEPIWRNKPETASRIRGRIEAILDYATARGWRMGENPARWRGHLDKLLPARAKVRKVKHHAALSYEQMPDFIAALHKQDGVAARALEFAILTAARTGETIGARKSEINLGAKLWTVPSQRMKAGNEHRVPLSSRAFDLAIECTDKQDSAQGKYIFAGPSRDCPLSNMAMAMVLRRMGRTDVTVHGFRSTFRDWAAERTNFARDVVEMALAHTIDDKVEAAYRRGDMLDKRRRLMEAWANFCMMPRAAEHAVAKFRRAG
jgi:integrase